MKEKQSSNTLIEFKKEIERLTSKMKNYLEECNKIDKTLSIDERRSEKLKNTDPWEAIQVIEKEE